MPVLFFTLCVFSFAFGIFNIITISFIRINLPERGLRSLLMPMVPLSAMTFIQLFHYYLSPTGSGFVMQSWWRAGYETTRILIAMGWISVTYYRYAMNGIETFKRGIVTGFAAGLFCLWILILIDLFNTIDLHQETIGNIGIVGTLFFAGFRAVAILRHRRPLLDSTKLALSLAIFKSCNLSRDRPG